MTLNKYFVYLKVCKILLALFILSNNSYAQYPPQYPLVGNDAIHKSDSRIKGWAKDVALIRGKVDIQVDSLGVASYGEDAFALNEADQLVVSLGDSGIATLTFTHPIFNGEGPDFAVFENGFINPIDSNQAYLELALVAVSSDGINFVQFPAKSNTQIDTQIDNFSYLDASKLHNLAGKYIGNYGTPFDLEELKDSVGLDINNITHIRIIDVIGSIDQNVGTKDRNGSMINDPYPSHFTSSGFDLDAVAVLNQVSSTSISNDNLVTNVEFYPNPVSNFLKVNSSQQIEIVILDIAGRNVWKGNISNHQPINISQLKPGIYIIKYNDILSKVIKI